MADYDEKKLASFFLRSGIALVLLYAGISALLNPDSWIGFIPFWLRSLLPGNFLLKGHSIFNFFIAGWVLSGRKVFYASLLAGLFLLSVIIFNLGALDIVFRDVAILFSIISLAVLSFKEGR